MMRTLRSWIASHFTVQQRQAILYHLHYFRALKYKGRERKCPLCNGEFSSFMRAGVISRSESQCPRCGVFERHRLLWLYLQNETDLLKKDVKVLEIGPFYYTQVKFKSYPNITYYSGDILGERAMVPLDVQDAVFKDDCFDFIICYSVLETVPDDKKALQELIRMLRPGGSAFLHVYIDRKRDNTFVDENAKTEAERRKAYGGDWNQRTYGNDFHDLLRQTGFELEIVNYAEELGEKMVEYHGLHRVPYITRCWKK